MRALIALLLCLSSPALADVSIVDGDTLRIDGERVRLWGFDAPERRQSCQMNGRSEPIGQEATVALRSILAAGPLRCQLRQEHDRNGRPVMECWAGATSIGDAMVRSGWAWAVPHFSKDLYLPAQEEAERANRGVWAGRGYCEAPARFRQQHRR
ncbi:thermonuclease family protein [Mycobacterium sp. KBS0706]|uniref:thermonuclease family protein n=1 Tax=Mycobacterium sp. KBS0706 TaxID=2578109 RepID=UPI00110FA2EB|nr:thermonuclease family protein [Mycobacterium sp. KBS0706]TSD83578.1 thermonuclease family protein [Mycobacterium sp. KBS0706]